MQTFEFKQDSSLDMLQEQEAKTILIVDDEAIIRDLCSKALKGYRILEAANGNDALAMFDKHSVDVILTDVMMPGMNGIELLKRLKEREPTLVVIVMTGYAEKDIILNALRADADDFITKPLNLLQLKTAVDKALVKKAMKEEIASLRAMDRFKTSFLSLVSHKFRTPITSISLFLQNLAAGVYDPQDPTFKQYLPMMYEESCYLEYLVADLLAFSKVMDAGSTLRFTACDLKEIIVKVVAESRDASRKAQIETAFDLEEVQPVSLDREKISFALRQVIDNAFKFSTEPGRVTISLRKGGDDIVIVVSDTGIGISREELPKVFEKFYQVDAERTGQIRGFGLGLFYAREFVKLHNGTISIGSEIGRGTNVTITLPASSR
ncbi:MAG: response regulator [Geobacter sp.]|nr:response regulator [Geobacter sp.]